MPHRPFLLLSLPLVAGAWCAPAPARPVHPADLHVAPETRRLEPVARALAIRLSGRRYRAWFDTQLVRSNPVPLPAAGRSPLLAWVPIREHREAWCRHRRLLVAAWEGGLPVAYGPEGDRHFLDLTRPPRTPVVLLLRDRSSLSPTASAVLTFSANPHGGVPCDSANSP